MQICKLCKKNEATKTNSHLITWALIKDSVNQKGFKERGYDFVFSISSFNTSKVHIGRSVLPEKIEDIFGSSTSNRDELQIADPFSRDFIFCPSCEDGIGRVENEFMSRVYSKLEKVNGDQLIFDKRGNKMFPTSYLEWKLTMLFAYSIFFRTSIASFNYQSLDCDTEETIRDLLLSNLPENRKELEIYIHKLRLSDFRYPLLVSYLQTYDSDENIIVQNHSVMPYFIWANRLAFQLYKKEKHLNSSIEFFYGLSLLINPKEYFHCDISAVFNICIISDEKRKKLIQNALLEMDIVRKNYITRNFTSACKKFIFRRPTLQERDIFYNYYLQFKEQDIHENWKISFVKAFNRTFNLKSTTDQLSI